MKKKIVLLLVLILSNTSFSQEKSESLQKKREFITGINLSVLSNLDDMNTSIQVTNGFLFNNRISASVGIGLEGSGYGTQLPAYLEGRYLLFNKKSHSPFVSIMAGYLQPLNQYGNSDTKGGFTSGIQIGYQNFFGDHVGISTSIGYRYKYQDHRDFLYYGYHSDIIYLPYPIQHSDDHRLEVKIALLLK